MRRHRCNSPQRTEDAVRGSTHFCSGIRELRLMLDRGCEGAGLTSAPTTIVGYVCDGKSEIVQESSNRVVRRRKGSGQAGQRPGFYIPSLTQILHLRAETRRTSV